MHISISPVSFSAIGRPKKDARRLVPLESYDGPVLNLTLAEKRMINYLEEVRAALDPSDRAVFYQISKQIRQIKIDRLKKQKAGIG